MTDYTIDAKISTVEQHLLRKFRDMVARKAHGELRVVFVDGVVTRCISQFGDSPKVLQELQAA